MVPFPNDGRSPIQLEARERIVNRIIDTLKRPLAVSIPECLSELKKIAVRFEEKIYTDATSQSDYLRKISLKMHTMETKYKNVAIYPSTSNTVVGNQNPADPGMGKNDKKWASWTPERDAYLLDLLVEYNMVHYRAQNGWTKEAWNKMTEKLNQKFPLAKFSRDQIKQHEQQMKKTYKSIHRLKNLSGMGWDAHRCMVEATKDVWDPLIAANKDVKKWQTKSFVHYDKLFAIHDGNIAQDKGAHSTIPPFQVEVEAANDIVQLDGLSRPLSPPHFSIPNHRESSFIPDDFDVGNEFHADSFTNHQRNQIQPATSTEALNSSSQAPHNVKKKQKVGPTGVSSLMNGYLEVKREENKLYAELQREETIQRSWILDVDPYSVNKCMKAVYELEAFTDEEIVRLSELFAVPFNREVFMSMTNESRKVWLKKQLSKMSSGGPLN